jgi:hypothetical protein
MVIRRSDTNPGSQIGDVKVCVAEITLARKGELLQFQVRVCMVLSEFTAYKLALPPAAGPLSMASSMEVAGYGRLILQIEVFEHRAITRRLRDDSSFVNFRARSDSAATVSPFSVAMQNSRNCCRWSGVIATPWTESVMSCGSI